MSIPDDLLDDEGYPTEEWLTFIREYVPSDELPIETFVLQYVKESWWMPSWGFIAKRKRKGKQSIELHTGGWSGNEDIINAIMSNRILQFIMGYKMWRRGGHYYFEMNLMEKK